MDPSTFIVPIPSVQVVSPVSGLIGGSNIASQQTNAMGGVGSTIVANGAAHAGNVIGRGKRLES